MSAQPPVEVRVDDSASRAFPSQWSPSAVNLLVQCPLRYWWRYAQGWSSAATVATAAGSITHDVLEQLLALPAPDRDPDAARGLYTARFAAFQAAGELPEGLHGQVRDRVGVAMRNYFALEDPAVVEPLSDGLEMAVAGTLAGQELAGRADRVEYGTGGARVVDYKTGSAKPRYAEGYWRQQLLYAALLLDAGIEVSEVELLYLGEVARRLRRPAPAAALARVTGELQVAAEQRAAYDGSAVWQARPGPLCGYCPFARVCPAACSGQLPVPGTADSSHRLHRNPDLRRHRHADGGAGDAGPDRVGDPEEGS